jgi:hypothetical protein
MVASMGMPGLAGMFGMGGAGGQVPPPFAGKPMAAPSMAQRLASQQPPGQGGPQGNIPPHILDMLAQMRAYNADPSAGQYPGAVAPQPGQTPWGQAGQAPQGQMIPGNWAGILSGAGGQMPWGPQQPPPPLPRQPVRPPPQQARPRRAVYGGGSAGNISLSGY